MRGRTGRPGGRLKVISPGEQLTLGTLQVELFPVCHSIPDAVGLIIHTPVGTVVHSGDFKVDYTPVDNHISRTVPFYELDTGLYFDRETKFQGGNFRQSLEPRA